ncbi:MAG: hypothetical protein L7F77_03880 [Candidatus Magnetominusculus sp. LBB02]|nr:hypothetical protein [Candidatus Magnetominusculus sp. LBB02]
MNGGRQDDLVVGVPLAYAVADKNGRRLLSPGYVIKDEQELNRIRELVGDSGDDSADAPQSRPRRISRTQDCEPFDLFKMIQRSLDSLLLSVVNSDSDHPVFDFPDKVVAICGMIQRLCNENEDLAIGVTFLDKDMRYTIKHPIHVAIICEAIAKGMAYSQEDRMPMLAAALTMNISMIELQEEMQFQSAPLSQYQKSVLLEHPVADHKLLQELGVTDNIWLTAILQHHESMDGSGYPRGLSGSSVTPQSQLISLTDIYTAMLSSRTYRAPMPSNGAMKKIFMANKKLGNVELELFVKNLGIYPPGTVVRLQNGEIGVVKYRGEKIDQPIVQALVNPNGTLRYSPQLRNTMAVEYKVVSPIPTKQINFVINKEHVWDYRDFSKQGGQKSR